MTVAIGPNRKYKISEENRLGIRIRKPLGAENGDECDRLDFSKGRVLEISTQGVKISSQHSFPFYKKLVIEFAPLDEGDKPFHVEVEVLGARPHPTRSDMWANECAFTEQADLEEIEKMIHEMARRGWLDRRESQRESRDEKASGRVEASLNDYQVSITDISKDGIGMFSRIPVEEGRKIRIDFLNENAEPKQLTVRAIRQTEVNGGYLIGCKIIRGSIMPQTDKVVPATLRPDIPSNKYLRVLNLSCLVLLIAFVIREFFRFLS